MDKKNPGRIERCQIGRALEIKRGAGADAKPEGSFSCYGATFNGEHSTSSWELRWKGDWMDVIAPGAFKESLAAHAAAGTMPAMPWGHDASEPPVGAWVDASEDNTGLKLGGLLNLKNERGDEIHNLLNLDLRSVGFSIGFIVSKAEMDEKAMRRTITGMDLLEISPVTIPAIGDARATDVKSLIARADFDPHNIRDLEALLREAGLSSSEAKGVLARGHKALVAARDAGGGVRQAIEELKKTLKGQ